MPIRFLYRGARRCPCGALADSGRPVCRKCAARARWLRRKARLSAASHSRRMRHKARHRRAGRPHGGQR